jgi:hypothetical protein
VSGIRISEALPRLAKQADRYALLRSVYHTLDDHARGMCWMLAGRLHDSIKYPTMGSVVARLRPEDPELPSFVTVPRLNLIAGIPEVDHSQTAGDLGPAWNPVVPNGVPGNAGFGLPDLDAPTGVNGSRQRRREALLDSTLGSPSAHRITASDLDTAQHRALDLIHSGRVREAFALDQEPQPLRERYGTHGFGQSALLARRLVERGVRFVTVNWPNYYEWDHHGNVQGAIKGLGPILDNALASLIEDLNNRGMLQRTLVICMGEFGRTPKLNKDAGRDHWVNVMSVLMAGGGIRGGQVIGSSTPDGYPDERPVHAQEMVATAYRSLGIDLDAELVTAGGRPFRVLPGVEPIHELL